LDAYFKLRSNDHIYFAGQITGVEGYVESSAVGLMVGITLGAKLNGKELPPFPVETALGSLGAYVSNAEVKNFQPMNINFGLMPPYKAGKHLKKKDKNALIAQRSLEALHNYIINL